MTARMFFGRRGAPLSVSASPTNPSGTFTNSPASNEPATRVVSSDNTTATAAGGAGGYTYSWARISGSADITAASPTSATTNFSATVPIGTSLTAVFRVTATDAASATATADVTVSLMYESGF